MEPLRLRFLNRHKEGLHRICAVSLFRPRVRNDRYRIYYESMMSFAEQFPHVFKNWGLYIYFDGSLFTNRYVYANGDPIDTWNGHTEDYYWTNLLRVLGEMRHVFLIQCQWDRFLEADGIHHHGLIGTLFRFHAPLEYFAQHVIVRDIDGTILATDYEYCMEWIRGPAEKQTFYYFSNGYNPSHRPEGWNEPFVSASMVGFAAISNDTERRRFWEIVTQHAIQAGSAYGCDELVLNHLLQSYYRPSQHRAIRAMDFYIGQPGRRSEERDNWWWLLHDRTWLLADFVNYCKTEHNFDFDINLTPPPKDDTRGSIPHYAGYLANVLCKYFRTHPLPDGPFAEQTAAARAHLIFWDQLLADNDPLFRFDQGIYVNGKLQHVDGKPSRGIETDANRIALDKEHYALVLPNGLKLNNYNLLGYWDARQLNLVLVPLCVNCERTIASLVCSHCSEKYCASAVCQGAWRDKCLK